MNGKNVVNLKDMMEHYPKIALRTDIFPAVILINIFFHHFIDRFYEEKLAKHKHLEYKSFQNCLNKIWPVKMYFMWHVRP